MLHQPASGPSFFLCESLRVTYDLIVAFKCLQNSAETVKCLGVKWFERPTVRISLWLSVDCEYIFIEGDRFEDKDSSNDRIPSGQIP